MKEMYKGVVNSPETTITNNIDSTDTIIYVLDETRLPEDLPNLMTLGTGTNAETVKVLSVAGSALTVQRGFQGIAKAWGVGTVIARNFTEYDYGALVDNVGSLADGVGGLSDDMGSLADDVGALDTAKVDKVAGKSLSTNDYTTAEKDKLAGIAAGANNYVHPGSGTNPHGTTKADVELGNVDNAKQMPISGGTFTGVATAQASTSYTTRQLRNFVLATANPSGGSDGDIWIKYT